MKLNMEVMNSLKNNSFFLKMILDLNVKSNVYKVVGDITEIYSVDSNNKIIKSIKLCKRVYNYNEMQELLKNSLYIIFLSLEVKNVNGSFERIDIYDANYMDIENSKSEYKKYISYLGETYSDTNEIKYMLI